MQGVKLVVSWSAVHMNDTCSVKLGQDLTVEPFDLERHAMGQTSSILGW